MGKKAMRHERMKRMIEKDHHEMKKKVWNFGHFSICTLTQQEKG